MRVLGIESSCDETGVAIYDGESDCLLAHTLYSQVEAHAEFGGVVPELASRDHQRKLLPLLDTVLADAGLAAGDINGVAYTAGPGLAGALMVGACTARAIAYGWHVPALGVHHMEGHVLAPLLEPDPPPFPFIALLVSGGHTMLLRADGIGQYRLLGESLDDAAGEAFDKTAKLLGLNYPGGPALAALAERGNPDFGGFPRPMTRRPGLDFSFSGLKTFARNCVHNLQAAGRFDDAARADVAAAFQEAVADTLVLKCRRALKQEQLQHLVVAGGVSANKRLRAKLDAACNKAGGRVWYPALEFCTDNGAMIAFAGYQRLRWGERDGPELVVRPRWPIAELPDPRQNLAEPAVDE